MRSDLAGTRPGGVSSGVPTPPASTSLSVAIATAVTGNPGPNGGAGTLLSLSRRRGHLTVAGLLLAPDQGHRKRAAHKEQGPRTYEMQGPRMGRSSELADCPSELVRLGRGRSTRCSVPTTGPGHRPEARLPGLPAHTRSCLRAISRNLSQSPRSCLQSPQPRCASENLGFPPKSSRLPPSPSEFPLNIAVSHNILRAFPRLSEWLRKSPEFPPGLSEAASERYPFSLVEKLYSVERPRRKGFDELFQDSLAVHRQSTATGLFSTERSVFHRVIHRQACSAVRRRWILSHPGSSRRRGQRRPAANGARGHHGWWLSAPKPLGPEGT